MKILLDTSILVDVDRGKEPTIELLSRLIRSEAELLVSTITISEILTGAYLNSGKAVAKAKEILGQFQFIDFDAEAADEAAKFTSHRIHFGIPIPFEDIAIAACAKVAKSDFLLTTNKKDFDMPYLRGKVFTPREFMEHADRLQAGWRLKPD